MPTNKRTKNTRRQSSTTNKKLFELLEANNNRNSSEMKELADKLGALTNFLIQDRMLRERASAPEKLDYIQNQKERRLIKKRIEGLLQKKKKDQMVPANEEPATPETKKSFKELSEESYSSGNFISGLFLEMIGKRQKKDQPVIKKNSRLEKIERERKDRDDLLKDLLEKQIELDKTSIELKKALLENNSKTTPTTNKTIPTLKEPLPESIPSPSYYEDKVYEKRDAADQKESVTEIVIKDIDPKAIRIFEGAFSKIKPSTTNSNSSSIPSFTSLPLGGGLFKGGTRLAGKVALPAAIAYGVYNFVSGLSDDSVKKNLTNLNKNKAIGVTERVKSGIGETVSGITMGLLGEPRQIVQFMDDTIKKVTNNIEPFLGDNSPVKILKDYFSAGTLEAALTKLSDTIFFWNKKENLPKVYETLPPLSETGIRKVPPVPSDVGSVIDNKFSNPATAQSIKKFVMSESSGRKDIINEIGASGLFQFIQSTALEQARKTGRTDIIEALKDKQSVDFSKDSTIKTLKEQKQFSKIPEYIKTTYPDSVAVAVSKLSEEQQTAMFEQYIKPLLDFKPNADFADIKAYGFAPKYVNALKKNDMDMMMYQKTEKNNPFASNPDFARWDNDKNGILTAKELVEGIRESFGGEVVTQNKTKDTKPKTVTNNSDVRIKPFLRFINPELSTMTQDDRKGIGKKLSPATSQLWDEIDKEFKIEMASGNQQKNEQGRVLYPIERLRIRNMYETITGQSSSNNGLSYEKLNKDIQTASKPSTPDVVSSEPKKTTVINKEEVLKEQRMIEGKNNGSGTVINSSQTNNIVAGGQSNQFKENRVGIRDVFNPYSKMLDRLWSVNG